MIESSVGRTPKPLLINTVICPETPVISVKTLRVAVYEAISIVY